MDKVRFEHMQEYGDAGKHGNKKMISDDITEQAKYLLK